MYRRTGSSESRGDTSPNSDLNGAPNLRRAVGELSSAISSLTCSARSSRLRSSGRKRGQRADTKRKKEGELAESGSRRVEG